MHPAYHFIIYFAIALVGTFFVITTIGNPFIKSFIIAIVVAVLATKDKN